jgi:hypothetical protein
VKTTLEEIIVEKTLNPLQEKSVDAQEKKLL